MQDLQEKSLRTSRALVAAVGISFVLLLAAAALTLRISRQADRADRWVVHTLEVKQAIARLMTMLTSAESGQRGYLITGDEKFLRPYESATRSVEGQVDRLRALIADSPSQLAELNAVAPIIEQRMATIRQTLMLSRKERHEEAAEIVRTHGSHLMQDIRNGLDKLDAAESQLLAERRTAVADLRTRFVAAVTIMLLACVALAFASLIGVRRYVTTMDESRRRLASYNAELEARVAERTAELEKAVNVATHERSRAEALLTDVNHRVGNNLALVSSFLTMQQRTVKNPEAARALNAARTRVQAIASAHRKLRLGADFATVKANEVLGAVLEDISAGLPPGDLIKIHYQLAPLEINARDAVSLGVLTSELVTNAVKHAFHAGDAGEIKVTFSNDGAAAPFLEVTDDGVGWHEKHTQDSGGLGTKIIDMVARQFGGAPQRSVRQHDSVRPGTRIRIDLARLHLMQSS